MGLSIDFNIFNIYYLIYIFENRFGDEDDKEYSYWRRLRSKFLKALLYTQITNRCVIKLQLTVIVSFILTSNGFETLTLQQIQHQS